MGVTFGIILLTVVVSVICFNNEELFNRLKFNAFDVKHSNQWYRFFTYGFLHANWVHLIINMFVFYSFGIFVENTFKAQSLFPQNHILYYILLYLGGLLLSVIPSFGKHKNDVFYNSVGASGAVSAVLFSSIILSPKSPILFFFIPVEIPSWIFGILYMIYEYYMSRRAKDNIGHDAHLWGAIYGIVFTILLKPSLATGFLQQIGILH
jgi:membrane associated rhomboid family serine protease